MNSQVTATEPSGAPVQRRGRLDVFALLLAAVALAPHIPFFANGYVDVERFYVEAAKQIADFGLQANLTDYFSVVANPILSVLMLAASYKLFGESVEVSRLTIFALSFCFALFLYFFLRSKIGRPAAFVAGLLVVVNPAFAVYSQTVYTDIPFMVFSSISVVCLLFSRSLKGQVLSSVTLGLALASKYVTAVLFPVAFFYTFLRNGASKRFSGAGLLSAARFNLWYFGMAILLSLPIILVLFRFRNTFIPGQFESALTLNANLFGVRFIAYLLWLGLFIGPSGAIAVADLWRKAGKKKFFGILAGLVALTLALSAVFPASSWHVQAGDFGEMNLGWIESVIPPFYLSLALVLVLLVAELFLANMVLDLFDRRNETARSLFLWILLPIILMSFTRVANRYMLAVLAPLSIYLALASDRMNAGGTRLFVRLAVIAHATIFLLVGWYSNYYLYLRGISG